MKPLKVLFLFFLRVTILGLNIAFIPLAQIGNASNFNDGYGLRLKLDEAVPFKVYSLNHPNRIVFQHLLNNGIPNAIYYPVPLHAQKAYQDNRYQEDDFNTTNELIETVISLPMHTELDKEQLAFITKTINDFVG